MTSTKPRLKLPEFKIPVDLKNVLKYDMKAFTGMTSNSKIYLAVLTALKNVESLDISENHYLQLLKLGLYLEEYENKVQMQKHALTKTRIKRFSSGSDMFEIAVEDLSEEKPWIQPGDSVIVKNIANSITYTLKVTEVLQNCIIASDDYDERFSTAYNENQLYNIKFRCLDYPSNCRHYALWLTHERNVTSLLFPCKSTTKRSIGSNYALKCYNKTMQNNAEQKQAIVNIVSRSSYPAPYILYGPPGTGKTSTLVEAICQIYCKHTERNVLVCTPSNTAANEITKRMLEFIPSKDIYRIYSKSTKMNNIDEEIQKCSNCEAGSVIFAKKEDILTKKIIVTTLCNCMRLILMPLPQDHFSYIIIDEAGQGTEPDILIPISLSSMNGKLYSQIILAGDPQQLGPTVISKFATLLLGRSILERLMSYNVYKKDMNNRYDSRYITKLIRNYRSHPDIIRIPNELFYENELKSELLTNGEKTKFPITFHGIKGVEKKDSSSPSLYNYKEIEVVLAYIDKLVATNIATKDIGVVTPFSLQSKKIKTRLKNKKLNDIHVGTVELFQGQERKIMIMTTVRSQIFFHDGCKHIGFLSNEKRFNVALTRAKTCLIIVGNPDVLQVDNNWRHLIQFCMNNNAYRGFPFYLRPINGIKQSGTETTKKTVSSTNLFNNTFKLFNLDNFVVPKDNNLKKSTIRSRAQDTSNSTYSSLIYTSISRPSYSYSTSNYNSYSGSYNSSPPSSSQSRSWKCNIL